jgi:hypothetical protein
MKRHIATCALLSLFIGGVVFADQTPAPWMTSVTCISEPRDFNPSFIGKVKVRVLASLSHLPNADIRDAEDNTAERIITIYIREIRKETAVAGESGAERYIMKRIPALHGITVTVKNTATGETAEHSETVTGYDYAPEGNPYADRFVSFFAPRPKEIKPALPMFRSWYLSAYAGGELPFAKYAEYSHGGGVLAIEWGFSPYRYSDIVLALQASFGAMSPTKGKLDEYYKFPLCFIGGYRVSMTPKAALLPSVGAGVTLHRIHGRTYANPSAVLQLKGLYAFMPNVSGFVQCGYSVFHDATVTGQSATASFGCQYGFAFE